MDNYYLGKETPEQLQRIIEEQQLAREYERLEAKWGPLTALAASGLHDKTGPLMDEAFARPNYSSRRRTREHGLDEYRNLTKGQRAKEDRENRNAVSLPAALAASLMIPQTIPSTWGPLARMATGAALNTLSSIPFYAMDPQGSEPVSDTAAGMLMASRAHPILYPLSVYGANWTTDAMAPTNASEETYEAQKARHRTNYRPRLDHEDNYEDFLDRTQPLRGAPDNREARYADFMSRNAPRNLQVKKFAGGGGVLRTLGDLFGRVGKSAPELHSTTLEYAPSLGQQAVRPTKSQWLDPNAVTRVMNSAVKRSITGDMPIDQATPINHFLDRLGKTFKDTIGTPDDPFEEAMSVGMQPFTKETYDSLMGEAADRYDTLGTREAWKKHGTPQYAGRFLDAAIWPRGPSKLADYTHAIHVDPKTGLIDQVSKGFQDAGFGWMLGKPGDTPIATESLFMPEILRAVSADLVGSLQKTGIPPKDWVKKPLPSLIDAVHKVITEGASKTRLETEAAAKNTSDFFKRLPSISPPDSPFKVSVIDNSMDPEDIPKALSAATDQHQFCIGGGCQHNKGRWEGYVPLLDPARQKIDQTGKVVWENTGPRGETNQYVKAIRSGDSRVALITDPKTGELRGTMELNGPDTRSDTTPEDIYRAWIEDSNDQPLAEFPAFQEWEKKRRTKWSRVNQIKGKGNSFLDDEAAAYVRNLLNEQGVDPDSIEDLANIKGVRWGKKITSAKEAKAMQAASAKTLRELIAEQGWPNYDTIKNSKDADWESYFKWVGASNIQGGGKTYSPGEIYNMLGVTVPLRGRDNFWPHADEVIEYLRANPQKYEPQALGARTSAPPTTMPKDPGEAVAFRDVNARRLRDAVDAINAELRPRPEAPQEDWDRYFDVVGRLDIPAGPYNNYSLRELEAMAADPEEFGGAANVWDNMDAILEHLRQNPRRFE